MALRKRASPITATSTPTRALNRGCTRVVFTSKRDGDYEIFSMNPDGSGLAQLTFNRVNDENPAWSPDGTRIAFQTDRDGQFEVYTMNADGSGLTRLTNNSAYDGQPAWSPDGTRLAFSSNRSGDYRIWAMNADGSSPVQLSTQNYSSDAAWSPDGRHIAYSADYDNNFWVEIWTMNADGSSPQLLKSPDAANTDYYVSSWSPDGDWVASTRISWTYSNNQWYWTTAYLDAVTYPGSVVYRLSATGEDWYPDWQTGDILPPTSSLVPLPESSPGSFYLTLSGSDAGPAGLKDYDIQVRVGPSGAWTDWRSGVGPLGNLFSGLHDQTLYFRSRARDWAFNLEAWSPDYETYTTVENRPPQSAVRELPMFTPNGAAVNWQGWDPGGSQIEKFDIQSRLASAPTWQDWLLNTSAPSAPFSGIPGERYVFRAKAMDSAQNAEDWSLGEGDASTTLYTWGMSGRITDPMGLPVGGAVITTTPAAFAQYPVDTPGLYGAYVAQSSASYTIDWGKPGYGDLPLTTFTGGQGGVLDVVLPPLDNLVFDGDFESGGLSGWTADGTLPPVISTQNHTGSFAALLGSKPQPSFTPQATVPVSTQYCTSTLMKMDPGGMLHLMCGGQTTMNTLYYSQRGQDGVWTAMQLISTNSLAMEEDYFYYDFDVDPGGVVHVIWSTYSDDNYDVFYRYRSPGGALSDVVNLSHKPLTARDGYFQGCSIAVDAYGQVHAAWDYRQPDMLDVFYSWRNTSGVWSSPVNMSDDPADLGGPELLADPFGRVHLTWTDNRSGNYDVYYRERSAEGTWSAPQNLTKTILRASNPILSVDDLGGLHIAWMEYQNYNPYTIRYRHRDVLGRWSNIEEITRQSGAPSLCDLLGDKDGSARIVWRHAGAYWLASRDQSGRWDKSDQIYTTNWTYCGNLFADALGKLHFFADETPQLRYRQRGVDGVWSNIFTLSANMQLSRPLQVQVESDGVLHSAYNISEPGPAYSRLVTGNANAQSILSQQVTLPADMASPTLSFLYQFSGGAQLSVTVDSGSSPSEIYSTNAYTQKWTHHWIDLSPWAGQTVTFSFDLQQQAGNPFAWALLDDVTVGASHPDLWLYKNAVSPSVLPGDSVVFSLTYGNQGGSAAAGVRITDTLPVELAFVSASPPPITTTPALVWDLPGLPAFSDGFTIQVTATLTSSVPAFSSVTNSASIAAVVGELERQNNLAWAAVFAGQEVYLPVVQRR